MASLLMVIISQPAPWLQKGHGNNANLCTPRAPGSCLREPKLGSQRPGPRTHSFLFGMESTHRALESFNKLLTLKYQQVSYPILTTLIRSWKMERPGPPRFPLRSCRAEQSLCSQQPPRNAPPPTAQPKPGWATHG